MRFDTPAKLTAARRAVVASLAVAVAAATWAARPHASAAARQQPEAARGLAREIRIRVGDGPDLKLYERSYALVIGVSDYAAGWSRLPGVKKDIEAVKRALQRHGFQVTVVENPDSLQLDKSFKTFIDEHGAAVENRLLFYFAGHGHTVRQSYGEEMGYIVPADAPPPARDARGFMSKAMDMQQMELYARRIQSKHALFLFDSCFSGSFFALARAVPESVSYKTARPVRQFITSGAADETVPDKSVFREQFVAALEGEADLNRDGYVTGTELGEFLQDKVVNYTRNAQHPQYGKIRNPNLDKGDFVFALPEANAGPALAASGGGPRVDARPPVDAAAVEQNYWDLIKDSSDANDFKAYLKKYPQGRFASEARLKISRADTAALARQGGPRSAAASRPAADGKSGRVLLLLRAESYSVSIMEVLVESLSKSLPDAAELEWFKQAGTANVNRYINLFDKLRRGDKKAGAAIPYSVVISGTITIDSSKPPVQGMLVARMSGTLIATDVRTGQTIAQETISDVRGFGNDREQAEHNAIRNAVEGLSQSFKDKVAGAAR